MNSNLLYFYILKMNYLKEKSRKQSPFAIASKRIKYLGIKLPTETKDLYSANYKMLIKETEEDINRYKDIPCSWIRRINIVKMTKLPKAIYRFNTIPIKLPIAFFTELEQKNIKIYMETQKNLKSQSNLEKEKRIWRNQFPWLWAIQQSYSHQNSMVLVQNIDQWKRIENPEINQCTCGQLIHDKGNKNTQC